ncbi:HEAT repeat domain-containing protein [Pirellulales bacterium]|nr:HEAT repeat domain-containing protein [Pirellulales bacterium]
MVLCLALGFVGILILALNNNRGSSVSELTSGLHAEGELVRLEAARGLGKKRQAAADAIPELTNLLNTDSPKVASAAAWALGNILSSMPPYKASLQPEAMTSLTISLEHQDTEVRRYAAYAMSLNPSIARNAMPQLTALLEDPGAGYVAARALGEIGPEARSTMSNLVALLDSSNPGHRAEAAVALSKLQPLPKDIVIAFMDLLEDDVDFVRSAARKALNNVDWSKVEP